MHDEPIARRGWSRRDLLRVSGLGGLGLVAAACTNTDAPTGSSSGTASGNKPPPFAIPDSGAKLPAGKVNLRWTDSGDAKANFFKAFFPAYHKKHPNIQITYNGTSWNSIQEVITLGLRNGSAPDVFQLPSQLTTAEAVQNGWLGVVDDIVPNWAHVKAQFPPGTFANGVTDFDGKTYGVPFTSSARINDMLLFNADYTKKAGYDLSGAPISWAEFREVAKKCTKQGNGKYYGFICGLTQQGGLSGPFSQLAEMSGLPGGFDAGNGVDGGINWKTGQFNYTSDLAQEAIELMLALKSDGSIFPGVASLDQPGARERMPQGVAAIILQGPWNIAAWQQSNPDFNLGVNLPPLKNPRQISPATYGPGGSNTWFYYAKSKVGPVIGDIYSYMATRAGQTEWADYDGGGDPPQFAAAAANLHLNPTEKKAFTLGQKYTALGPEPAVRNPDVSKVYEAYVPVQPNCSDTLNGLFTGQVKGKLPKVLKDLQDRSEKSLEVAIAKAKSQGAKISRDDWVFADWNPEESYAKLYKT